MSEFGDGKLEKLGDAYTADTPENKYLFSPYGTKNSKEFKQNDGIILSPSGISKFFNNPAEWYDDRYGTPIFNGNTNTVLGNAVHASIEQYYRDGTLIPREEMEWWIIKRYTMNPDVDKNEVLRLYQQMVNVWIQEYGLKNPKPDMIEQEVELIENNDIMKIGTFGTADAIFGNTLVDWKTCGTKPKGIGNYKHQLMQYARAFRKAGIADIHTIKIVYIQKATKTIPPRLHIFEQKITKKDIIEADYFAELQVNALLLAHTNPDIKDLVFRVNPISMYG